MRWKDTAILLTVRKTGKKTLLIELFTESHGRQRGILQLGDKDVPPLPPGCHIDIEMARSDLTSDMPGDLTIMSVSGGVAASSKSDVGFLVLTCIKSLLSKLLPEREPLHDLFYVTTSLIDSLSMEDGLWPVEYARWEMCLLDTLGHVDGLRRCLPDFRQGETIYISPASGKVVTRLEAGAFLDKLLPVPAFLMGSRLPGIRDVQEALRMTKLMLERLALPKAGVKELPPARAGLIEHTNAIRELPRPAQDPLGMEETGRRRRRMSEINNPLLIGGRA